MVMFSPETSEIAKPSELLASVKSYMSVLQCVENYVNIDITRVSINIIMKDFVNLQTSFSKKFRTFF